ncbi:MAG: hypothetical protein P8175_08330 [Deltaproteobacteria bacterium]
MVQFSDLNDYIIAGCDLREDLAVVVGDHLSDFFELVLLHNELKGLAGCQ